MTDLSQADDTTPAPSIVPAEAELTDLSDDECLARLARAASEDRRALLGAAGVALEVHTPDTPVWVSGSP